MIKNYNDFTEKLTETGFSMAGGNSEGIFSVISWNWCEQPPYDTPVRWHTGDPETDPWEWRMRVLNERDDIAYGKIFFNKGGFITKEWYPYFLAVRRGGASFEETYTDGKISHFAKRIYDVAEAGGSVPMHEIKQLAGFTREDKPRFDRALVELQMKLYLTVCGNQQKVSQKGEEYGWHSTVFCAVERFFGGDVFNKADKLSAGEAEEAITEHVLKINPDAPAKKIVKFIRG
ncbi:MAG: hypothetical protein FWE91_02045 [Defluviitaleaceae bacterium]|nr:hypothetical protein [Defluviitaleaceae bacterium]MCL2836090.1 hypothetical protein [Defluviitaleaceae bacterium]